MFGIGKVLLFVVAAVAAVQRNSALGLTPTPAMPLLPIQGPIGGPLALLTERAVPLVPPPVVQPGLGDASVSVDPANISNTATVAAAAASNAFATAALGVGAAGAAAAIPQVDHLVRGNSPKKDAPAATGPLFVRSGFKVHTLEDEQKNRLAGHFDSLQKALQNDPLFLKEAGFRADESFKLTIGFNNVAAGSNNPVDGFVRGDNDILVKFDLLKASTRSPDIKTALEALQAEYTGLVQTEADKELEESVKRRFAGATVDLIQGKYTLTDAQGKETTTLIPSDLINARDFAKEQGKLGALHEGEAGIHMICRYPSQDVKNLSERLAAQLRKKRGRWFRTSPEGKAHKEIQEPIQAYRKDKDLDVERFVSNRRWFLGDVRDADSPSEIFGRTGYGLDKGYLEKIKQGIKSYVETQLQAAIEKNQRAVAEREATDPDIRFLENELAHLKEQLHDFSTRFNLESNSCEIKLLDSDPYKAMLLQYIEHELSKVDAPLQDKESAVIRGLKRGTEVVKGQISGTQNSLKAKQGEEPSWLGSFFESTAAQNERKTKITGYENDITRLEGYHETFEGQVDCLDLLKLVPLAEEVLVQCLSDTKLGQDLSGISGVFDARFLEVKGVAEQIKGARLDVHEMQHLLDIFAFVAQTVSSKVPVSDVASLKAIDKALLDLVAKYEGARAAKTPDLGRFEDQKPNERISEFYI